MIETARDLGGCSSSGEEVRYKVCVAEKIAGVHRLEAESADMVIAAMTAKVGALVRYGGVLGTGSEGVETRWDDCNLDMLVLALSYVHALDRTLCHGNEEDAVDPSTPNAKEVQGILFKLQRETLAPIEILGNRLSREMYDDLPMSWAIKPPIKALPKSSFTRRQWGRDGVLSNGESFFNDKREIGVDTSDKQLSTAGMVTPWREANPLLVGTDDDGVTAAMRELKAALGEASKFKTGNAVTLLLSKKAQ
ncbi:hypothetical protein MMC25_008054 [Agyrium rufum]|nr:hypothetical protein [Agyrium rufum]